MKKTPSFKKTELLGLYIILFSAVLGTVGYIVSSYGMDNKIFQFMLPLASVVYVVGNWLLTRFVITKHREIELNDERNIKIREKSAHTTFFVTLLCLVVAVITFIVLGMWLATIIIIGVQIVHVVSFLAFRYINNKKL